MECPPSPRDPAQRNIIDKLADFVARNGPEFELITKQKQQGNPKFEFLRGGDHANYYLYKKAQAIAQKQQEEEIQRQQQQIMHHQSQGGALPHYPQGPPHDGNQFSMNPPPPAHLWNSNAVAAVQQHTNGNTIAMTITAQIEAINMQQSSLREQIHQSEANLTAQHTALMTKQQSQIDEAIEKAQNAQLEKQAEENGISLPEFDGVLQPIIESCTKDSISAGKNWILQHSSDSAKNNVVLQYLLKKALVSGSTFQQKLHLIYLVNDVLHHCVRKNANDLKNSLENVVIPMFCSAVLIASPDQRSKLTKLLSLWESKAKFFDACVISKLQSPDSSMQEYKTNLQNIHHEVVAQYAQNTKTTFESYQKQHQTFIHHATLQITQLEQQKQQLEQQMLATVMPNAAAAAAVAAAAASSSSAPPSSVSLMSPQSMKIPSLMAQKIAMPHAGGGGEDAGEAIMPPGVDDNNYIGVSSGGGAGGGGPGGGVGVGVGSSGTVSGNSPVGNIYSQPQPQPQPQPPYSYQQQHQQQQGHQMNHFASDPQIQGPNFFIPDLSKPPPGFISGSGVGVGVGVGGMNVPHSYPPMVNIPSAPGAVVPNSTSAIVDNPHLASNVNAGILAAIQMVQHQHQQLHHHNPFAQQSQQHQQQQQQQQHHQQQQQQQQQQQTPHLQDISNHHPYGVGLGIDNEQPPTPPSIQERKPKAPYYDLPAGLMVPLIRLDDYKYRPLDPSSIRLPPPTTPSERLTNALAAFYAPPTHDRPRDTEGWEKLGLYEYYKVKNAARKQKEEEIVKGVRQKSRSPSPIVIEKPKPKKVNKRYYSSRSRSRSRSRSPLPIRSRSRSRSRSPRVVRDRGDRPNNNRGNRYGSGGGGGGNSGGGGPGLGNQRIRSPRRSSPQRDRDRDRDREGFNTGRGGGNNNNDNRAERNNGNAGGGSGGGGGGGGGGSGSYALRRERERSVTPPSFFGNSFTKASDFIEESNKGHQMLMKMGWGGSGTGLGTKHQGIDQPITAGEIRDRKDMYKGVGVNLNDPYENFRKNKGAAFVHRMRARDEKS